jgi:hypothetical protein
MRIGLPLSSNIPGRQLPGARTLALSVARLGPWVVFGPITGLMSEAAVRCFQNGKPRLALLWLTANALILIALPVATALMARRL